MGLFAASEAGKISDSRTTCCRFNMSPSVQQLKLGSNWVINRTRKGFQVQQWPSESKGLGLHLELV